MARWSKSSEFIFAYSSVIKLFLFEVVIFDTNKKHIVLNHYKIEPCNLKKSIWLYYFEKYTGC